MGMGRVLFWNSAGVGILFLAGIGVELMPNVQSWLWSGIVWGIAFIWAVGVLMYWLRHRKSGELEIRIVPNRWLEGATVKGRQVKNPNYSITPGHRFTAIFDLVLSNHSQNHKVHIKSANILLTRRMLFWNRKPLFSMPLQVQSHPNDYVLQNVDIEPLSEKEYTINTGGAIPVINHFPRKSRLVVQLELIGPTCRIDCLLEDFRHDLKLVPDIPDWKKQ